MVVYMSVNLIFLTIVLLMEAWHLKYGRVILEDVLTIPVSLLL